MDKKKKSTTNPTHNCKNSTLEENNLSLPLPQVLLELHAQFYCGNMNTGHLTGKAKEQKQSKVQPADIPPPP